MPPLGCCPPENVYYVYETLETCVCYPSNIQHTCTFLQLNSAYYSATAWKSGEYLVLFSQCVGPNAWLYMTCVVRTVTLRPSSNSALLKGQSACFRALERFRTLVYTHACASHCMVLLAEPLCTHDCTQACFILQCRKQRMIARMHVHRMAEGKPNSH